MTNFPLTDIEIKDIAEKLKKLEPGFLPFDLFYQFNRLKVTITIEVVPLCFDPEGNVLSFYLIVAPTMLGGLIYITPRELV